MRIGFEKEGCGQGNSGPSFFSPISDKIKPENIEWRRPNPGIGWYSNRVFNIIAAG
jgi:hypothetical protein